MSSGVALLFQYYVTYAQNKSLETKDYDNIVAASNIRILEVSVTGFLATIWRLTIRRQKCRRKVFVAEMSLSPKHHLKS